MREGAFVSDSELQVWLEEAYARLDGGRIYVYGDRRPFQLSPAVQVGTLAAGEPGIVLSGTVLPLEELSTLGFVFDGYLIRSDDSLYEAESGYLCSSPLAPEVLDLYEEQMQGPAAEDLHAWQHALARQIELADGSNSFISYLKARKEILRRKRLQEEAQDKAA